MQRWRTKPNGDCFFESVSIILDSFGIKKSPHQLRHVVAYAAYAMEDRDTKKTVQSWRDLYIQAHREKDYELMATFRHAYDIARCHWPLSETEKRLFYKVMMDKTRYWGEEFAVRILEKYTRTNLIVIASRSGNTNVVVGNCRFKRFAMLYLDNDAAHYEPIEYNGEFIFAFEDLPPEVQKRINASPSV